jgi:hypothetical protein
VPSAFYLQPLTFQPSEYGAAYGRLCIIHYASVPSYLPFAPMTRTGKVMTPESYISDRLEQYQGWYDRKAVASKSRYLRMRAFSVVGGGLVPVLVNVPWKGELLGIPIIQAVVTVISLLVVIVVSLESVFHYREQWKNYRSTEQYLGHEKFLFSTRVGRYEGLKDEEAFHIFVGRVEEAIAAENAATLNVMTMANEPSDPGKKATGQR